MINCYSNTINLVRKSEAVTVTHCGGDDFMESSKLKNRYNFLA